MSSSRPGKQVNIGQTPSPEVSFKRKGKDTGKKEKKAGQREKEERQLKEASNLCGRQATFIWRDLVSKCGP